jgi:hypothetical protein
MTVIFPVVGGFVGVPHPEILGDSLVCAILILCSCLLPAEVLVLAGVTAGKVGDDEERLAPRDVEVGRFYCDSRGG